MRMICIKLPVANLSRARDFYAALGFTFNEAFSSDTTTSVVLDENIVAVIMTEEKFHNELSVTTGKPSAGPTVINCLTVGRRDEVDQLAAIASKSGGNALEPDRDDHLAYTRSFADPDGNIWQAMYMSTDHIID